MWKIIENRNWERVIHTFDWVRDMQGVVQDPIFHAEGDVLVHTRLVTEALLALPEFQKLEEQSQHILYAAALLHDVEKRSTTVIDEDGRVTSKGHAKKGEFTVRRYFYEHGNTPFSIREQVAKLVRYHGLPLWVFEKEDPLKALLKTSLEVNTELLYLLAKADILGRICPDQAEQLYRIELFKAFCEEQDCFGKAAEFPSVLSRFTYFHKADKSRNYQPFDDARCEVIMLSGLPGTGKDTCIQRHFKQMPIVSLDALRIRHKIKASDKKAQGKIIQLAKEEAKNYLLQQTSFVWNATNLTQQIRQKWIDFFTTYRAKVRLIYLEVPYRQVLQQNRSREAVVPMKVMEKMLNKLEVPAVWEARQVEYIVLED